MEKYEEEIEEITPQLNDKLMVALSIIRNMRDEDIPKLRELIRIDEAFRARLRAQIPVAEGEDRRVTV